jgi:hypothetical protein
VRGIGEACLTASLGSPRLVASWELRLGDLRVFYEVADDDAATVRILAVGLKRGNTVWIGGHEVKL